MTPRIPIYSDTGTCNFCQATTRWGGAPHAPGCAYYQALTDITAHGTEVVEQAAAMLAQARANAARALVVLQSTGWSNASENIDESIRILEGKQ